MGTLEIASFRFFSFCIADDASTNVDRTKRYSYNELETYRNEVII